MIRFKPDIVIDIMGEGRESLDMLGIPIASNYISIGFDGRIYEIINYKENAKKLGKPIVKFNIALVSSI